MISQVKQKAKNAWSWAKRKANGVKRWIIALFIGGTVLAAGLALIPDGIPSVSVNGKTIDFPYTDDNSNENLIIHTDKETYGGWNQADMYMAIENKSGKGQVLSFSIFAGKANISGISRLNKDISYLVDITDYATSTYDCGYTSTSTDELVSRECQGRVVSGSHNETRHKDEWRNVNIDPFSKPAYDSLVAAKNINPKGKKGLNAKNKSELVLLKGETAYFKIRIEFPPKSREEFFLEVLGSEGGYGHLDPWYDSNFTYKKQIDIDPAKVSAALTDFTFAVILATGTNMDFSLLRSDGFDVIFTGAAEAVTLDFEIDFFDATVGDAVFWVQATSVSSTASTTLFMYYGNSAASDTSSSTATWDENYEAVYHLGESSGSTIDSTSNNYDATMVDGLPDQRDTPLGNGQHFDGTNDLIKLPTITGFGATGTIEIWANQDATGQHEQFWIISNDGTGGFGQIFVKTGASANVLAWHYNDTSGATIDENLDTNYLVSGRWTNFTMGWAANDGELWEDGLSTTTDTTVTVSDFSTASSSIGADEGGGGGGRTFTGFIDEFRISNIKRSTAYALASFHSGADSLLEFLAQETESVAARRVIIIE